MLLSSPVCLIEYIYLLRDRAHRIFQYGIYTFSAQLILLLAPVIAGKGYFWSVYGLLVITGLRWIWLIIILRRYARWKISYPFMREHIKLGAPLILTTLIAGSAQYTDGAIVSAWFDDPKMFAIFRYGAKEFPIVLMLAAGLNNALLPQFGTRNKFKESLATIKHKSGKLMHVLFPLTMVTLVFSRWLYPRMFTPEFLRSADIFMVYLLLVIPRMIFPHTIIIGRKRTRVAMWAAILVLILNIPLSLWLVQYYGTVGVALATFIVYVVEKIFLVSYLWIYMKIKPKEYIPLLTFAIYSVLLGILFVLVDRRILDIH
jgi:O-antigen/teichoic acid export membrane protein